METRELQEAAERLGRAHRKLRHARAQSQSEVDAILDAWVRDHGWLFDHGDGDSRNDELVAASKEYLRDGAPIDETVDDELRAALSNGRLQLAPQLRAALEPVEHTAASVVAPYEAFTTEVRRWLDQRRTDGAVPEWATVLDLWRSALSLTTREAGEALGVSASAVTRYLRRVRTPSMPQLIGMVEAMTTWDPTSEDENLRTAARTIVSVFGDDPDKATEILEDAQRRGLDLEDIVGDALDALSQRQLAVLAALAATPRLLDGLAALADERVMSDLEKAAATVRIGLR